MTEPEKCSDIRDGQCDDDLEVRQNTYQGRRTDLWEKPTKAEIKKDALMLLTERNGILVSELAQWSNVSRRWARKVLLEMEEEGIVRKHPCSNRRVYLFLPAREPRGTSEKPSG